MIIWVEADGGTTDNAPLGNITTNGGHIWVGGGSGTKTWNSLTIGDGAAYANTSGTVVAIPLYGNISTGGGDILLVAAATGSDGNGYVDIEAITSDREINSGSGDITFLVEDIDFDWNNNDGIDIIITSTGVFTIAPTSQANKWTNDFVWEGSTLNGNFSGTGDLVGIEINNISSLTGLSLGTFNDATYTPVDNVSVRNIDLNEPLSIGGAVTLYGLHVNLNDITTTGSTGYLYVKAAGDIEQSLNDQISTAGGDVVYWADFDGNGGRITVKYHISTQGGNIWMGGGPSSETVGGLVVPTGYAKSITINQPGVNIDGVSALAGIVINSRVSGNATGGSIRIKGIHDESGDGSSDIGVKIVDCDIYSSTGNISILGTTTNDLFQGAGLWIGTDIHSSTSTGNVTITTTSGDIYLEGISASNVGTYQWAHGLMMFMNGGDDISIASTTGNIVLKGDGAVSSARSGEAGGLVVQVNNTSSFFSINTDGGAITFEGNSGNSGDDLGLCFRAQDIANSIKIGDNNTGNIIAKCGSLQTTVRNTLGVIGFEGIGSYVFEPISTSFAVSPTITDEYSFASSGTGFRFGKTGNTSTTTIDIPLSVNGPIEVYGGGVDIDANLTSNNNPILLSASVNLQLAAGSSNITLNAGTGSITLESNLIAFDGSTSTSNNTRTTSVTSTGVLTIRPHGASTSFNAGMLGGSDGSTGTQFNWTGALSGSTWQITSGTLKNLYINNVSSLGGLVLQKENVTTPVLISSPIIVSGPISVYGGAIAVNANMSATGGDILLDADLGNSLATGLDGINVADNVTIETVTSGNISIIGRSTSGAVNDKSGFRAAANTTISSAGTLSITGTCVSSSETTSRGINLIGTFSAYGDVSIRGDDNVANTKDGVVINGASVSSTNGSISIHGDGGSSIYGYGTNSNTAKNNINLYSNKIYFSTVSVHFDADGVVNILAEIGSTSFSAGLTLGSGITFDAGITGLTIGNTGNTQSVTINSPIAVAGPISVYGTTITLNDNLTTTSASNGDILLQGAGLTGSGNITVASERTATINTSGNSTFAGVISGTSSSFTKQGAGTLTLSNTSTYSGPTTISAGTIQLGVNNALPNASSLNVVTGATLALAGFNQAVGPISGGGTITSASGTPTLTCTVNSDPPQGFLGSIGPGAITLIKAGTATLTLSRENSYTGATSITGGKLRIGNAGKIGAGVTTRTYEGNISISDGATFEFGSNTDHIFTGVISGAGGLSVLTSKNITPSSFLTLTGQNTFTGPIIIGNTDISKGYLKLSRTGGGTIASTSSITVSGPDGTLQVSSDQELGNLSLENSGKLIVDNGVSLTNYGSFGDAGIITNNGTIVIKGGSTFPGAATTVSAMNHLTIDRAGGVTLNNDLDVAGTLTLSSGVLDAGTVTLTVSGTIAGASSATYIKTSSTGVLKMAVGNSSSKVFPVGRAYYNPVSIKSNAASDEFTVRVDDVLYMGAQQSNPRVEATWFISKRETNGQSGVDFTFEWDDAQEREGISTYRLQHYNGTSWEHASGNPSAPNSSNARKVKSHTGYTGTFSPFAIGSSTSVLPVTWHSFTATQQGSGALLQWATATEQNTKDFVVEYSTNAMSWLPIGTVAASGNSSSLQYYSMVHKDPVKGQQVHLYRIQQRDLDGKFSYSKIVRLQMSGAETGMLVYPNPARDVINVYLSQPQELHIISITGAEVWRSKLPAGNHQIQVGHLLRGMYIVATPTQQQKVVLD